MNKKSLLVGLLLIVVPCWGKQPHTKRKKPPVYINKQKRPLVQPVNFERVSVVNLGNSLHLDSMDYPTPEAIQRLVEEFWPNLAPATIALELGGSFTSKLFSASHFVQGSSRKVFFLKICNKRGKDAWKNLKKVQESKVGTFCGYRDRNTPIITGVETFFIYENEDGLEYTIEVTHAAKGECVANIIRGNAPQTEKITCALAVGASLASFHQAFITYQDPLYPELWVTVTHGDFHAGNIFFHNQPTHSRVYFIDNETIANSLDTPQPIGGDIMSIYGQIIDYVTPRKTSDEQWVDMARFLHYLIKGYVKSYPREKREALICYLEAVINGEINKQLSYFDYTSTDQEAWTTAAASSAATSTSSSTPPAASMEINRLKMLLIETKNLIWYMF